MCVRNIVCWVLCVLGLSACVDVTTGECPAPSQDMLYFYKADTAFTSHDYCVMCDLSVPPADTLQWGEAMGTEVPPGTSPSDLTPCVYVYPSDAFDTESLASCKAAICSGQANTNDQVFRSHGVWTYLKDEVYPDIAELPTPEGPSAQLPEAPSAAMERPRVSQALP